MRRAGIVAEKFDVTVVNQYENENVAMMLHCMSKAGTSKATPSSGTGSAATSSGMQMTATATVNIRSKATTSSLVHRFINNWPNHAGCRFECAVQKTQA